MVDVGARLEGATLNPDSLSWLAEGEVLLTIGYADSHGVYHRDVHPFHISRRLPSLPEGTGWTVTGVSVRGYQLHLAEFGSDRSLTIDLALDLSPIPVHVGQPELVELLAGEIWDTFTLLATDPKVPGDWLTSLRPVISALWGEVEVTSCRGGDGNITISGMVHLRWELRSGASETEFDESIPFVRVLMGFREAEAAWEAYAGIIGIRLGEGRDSVCRAFVEVALWGIGKRLVPAAGGGPAAPVVKDLRASVKRTEGEAMPDRALVHVVAETEVFSAASGGEVTYRQFSADGTWLLPIRGLRSRDKVEASATVKQVLAVRTPEGELRGARLILRVEAIAVRREPRRMPAPDPRGRGDREVWLVDTLVGQSTRDVVLMVEFRQGPSGVGSDASRLVPVRVGRWEHEIRIAWPLPEEANGASAFRADIEDLEVTSGAGRAVLEGTALVYWRTAVQGPEGAAEKRVALELPCSELRPNLPVVCFWEPQELGIHQAADGSPVIELRAGLTLVAYRNEVDRIPMISSAGGFTAVLIEGGAAGTWAEEAIRLSGPVRSLDLALGRPESAIDGIFLVWKVPVILKAIPATWREGPGREHVGRDEAGRVEVRSVVAQGHIRAKGLPDKPVWRYVPSIRGVAFSDDGTAMVSISAVARYFAVRGPGEMGNVVQVGWGSYRRSEREWEQTVVFDLDGPVTRISEVRVLLQPGDGGRINADVVYVTGDNRQRHRRFGIPLRQAPGAQSGVLPKLIAYHAQLLRTREPGSIRLTFRLVPATGEVFASRRSQGCRED